MTDTGTPAAPAAAPATGEPPAPPTEPVTGDDGGDNPFVKDPAAALAALNKANKEAADRRKELDALAQKVREYEDRDKTAEQLADEDRKKLADENAELRSKADRAEVAATKGVPVDILPVTGTREQMEAAADAALAWKGEPPTVPTRPAPNPNQGKAGAAVAPTADDWLRSQVK